MIWQMIRHQKGRWSGARERRLEPGRRSLTASEAADAAFPHDQASLVSPWSRGQEAATSILVYGEVNEGSADNPRTARVGQSQRQRWTGSVIARRSNSALGAAVVARNSPSF